MDGFEIVKASKKECEGLLKNFHYLTNISRGFKSGENYILVHNKKIVGVCIFTGFPVPELSVGMLGLSRDEQEGLYELSRLVIHPKYQDSYRNLTSWFVARCMRMLRSEFNVKVILSYADQEYHVGYIYQALNFKYYGLTDTKKDFWFLKEDGSYEKHSRGSVKGIEGEWRPRSRKHRYALVFDKKLKVLWEQSPYPKG